MSYNASNKYNKLGHSMRSWSNYDDVGLFHDKFGLPNTTQNDPHPQHFSGELYEFRRKFLYEELKEFEEGWEENDPVKMFDSLIDLVYVAMGTAHLMGFPWQAGWQIVQEANMAKVRALPDGSNSRRGSRFDVVKPEGWVDPKEELTKLLEGWGWDLKHKTNEDGKFRP